jgi:hypothetical protein
MRYRLQTTEPKEVDMYSRLVVKSPTERKDYRKFTHTLSRSVRFENTWSRADKVTGIWFCFKLTDGQRKKKVRTVVCDKRN